MDEYKEKVLKAIRDYEKQLDHVEQYEIVNAIGELYEIIRAIPTYIAEEVRLYDSVWDMYYDEFDDEEGM